MIANRQRQNIIKNYKISTKSYFSAKWHAGKNFSLENVQEIEFLLVCHFAEKTIWVKKLFFTNFLTFLKKTSHFLNLLVCSFPEKIILSNFFKFFLKNTNVLQWKPPFLIFLNNRNVDHAFWSHALLPKSSTRAKPIPHSWLRHSWGIGSALVDDLVITHGFAMRDHHNATTLCIYASKIK